jgi:hypothetical protein
MMDLEFYQSQAQLKQKEHKKFLDQLKKKPPDHRRERTKTIRPNYKKDFLETHQNQNTIIWFNGVLL